MRRLPLLAVLAAVLVGGPAWAQRVAEKPPSLVPFWLPREVALVTFFHNSNITPELRLAWHITVVQQRIDSFNFIFEGGGGWAAAKRSTTDPDTGAPPVTEMHQWHIHGGISYEGDWASGWHIGARVTAGVTLFGANFVGAPKEGLESAATVEGRVEGGYRLGRVVYGLSVGILQPWSKNPRLYSVDDIGGFSVGLFANWR
jgi:hypothetical protein